MKFIIILTVLLSGEPMTLGVLGEYKTVFECRQAEKSVKKQIPDALTRCLPIVLEGYNDPI